MIGTPERWSVRVRALAHVATGAAAAAVAAAGMRAPVPGLAALEIVPLIAIGWLFPLPAGLLAATAAALLWLKLLAVTDLGAALPLAAGYLAPVALAALARQALAARLDAAEAQYRAIGDAIPYGVWSMRPDGDLLYVSPSFLNLVGTTWERTRGTGWVERPGPDQPSRIAAFEAITRAAAPFEFEREVAAADGRTVSILTRGRPVHDADGNVARIVGINLDITARTTGERSFRESEERYRYLAESIPQIVWICDPDGRVEFFNQRWFAYSGARPGDPIRGVFRRAIHPLDRDRSFTDWFAAGRAAHETYESEIRLRSADGTYRWFLSRAVAQTDRDGAVLHWFGTSTDIDARKRAQDQLTFLARASDALAGSLDIDGTCNVLARLAVPSIADWCAVFLVEGDAAIRTVALVHDDPAGRDRAWAMERRYRRTLDAPGFVSRTIRTGELQSVALDDPAERRASAQDEAHERLLERLDFGATICVPMTSGPRTIGAIALINRESQRTFEPADFALARELARRAAAAIENARAYDRERRVADALQAAFLPASLPRIPGLAFDAVYAPGVDESSVGGDWYDAFRLGDGRIVLSIGDVAGRGLRAAVVMGRVREAIRAFALQELAPEAILAAAERVLRLGGPPTMVTALVALADPVRRTLTIAAAGHPPALLAQRDGTIDVLEVDGIPLGVFDDVARTSRTVALPDDALLVLYTDGLIEIGRDVVAGIAALRAAVAAAVDGGDRTATAIYRRIVAGAPSRDDVAVLTMATEPLGREPVELDLPAVPDSVRLVRTAIARFARAHGLADDRRFAVSVAVGEAVTNAIEHAYGIGTGRLTLRAERRAGELAVLIRDYGTWRAPRAEGRGRGIALMRAFAAHLEIERETGGTTVRMSFADGVEAYHAS